jgi:hypothetical protein
MFLDYITKLKRNGRYDLIIFKETIQKEAKVEI